jgi:hypothetical protein
MLTLMEVVRWNGNVTDYLEGGQMKFQWGIGAVAKDAFCDFSHFPQNDDLKSQHIISVTVQFSTYIVIISYNLMMNDHCSWVGKSVIIHNVAINFISIQIENVR